MIHVESRLFTCQNMQCKANSIHDDLLILLLHYVYPQNFICIKKHAYHVLKFTFTTLPRLFTYRY